MTILKKDEKKLSFPVSRKFYQKWFYDFGENKTSIFSMTLMPLKHTNLEHTQKAGLGELNHREWNTIKKEKQNKTGPSQTRILALPI